MKFSVRFFSSLYISLLSFSVSSNVLATQTEKPERWFEIEVILFEQLGDKKAFKEKFPDKLSSATLPLYEEYFDLLTPYIQPNLTSIKQFIPLCSDNGSENESQYTFLKSLSRINTPFPDAIKVIEHVNSFNMPKFITVNKPPVALKHQTIELTQNNYLLEKATVELKKEELASPLFSTQSICIISRKDIEKIYSDEQLVNFQFDTISVESVPTTLSPLGTHISDSPYLIANESLLLADIKQRLQWSKEFKPLLHFGWRQVGITRDKAIPLKLFAGKHLDYQYQQALRDYQSTLDEAKQTEQLIPQQLSSVEQQEIDNGTAKIEQEKQRDNNYAEIKQQQLTQLFNELDMIDSANINSLIGDIERQTFEELIAINEINRDKSKPLNISNPPVNPLQPWFLDGFFKVHLDHYLYITADFNVLSQPLDKSTNNGTGETNVKLINFSQNKRAITGEIHYFDHPYIGMIVQIRRFDPSKPKEDAVSQVVN